MNDFHIRPASAFTYAGPVAAGRRDDDGEPYRIHRAGAITAVVVERTAVRSRRRDPVVLYGRPLRWREPSRILDDESVGPYRESFTGPEVVVMPSVAPLVLGHDGRRRTGGPRLSMRSTAAVDALGLQFRWELRDDLDARTLDFLTSAALPLSVAYRDLVPPEVRGTAERPHRHPRRVFLDHVAVVGSPAYPSARTIL